jgi:hypothetical protein
MDHTALQRRLAQIEAKIAGVQHQIGEQREVIVKLESAGEQAKHAKYLLAGLELLQAVHRDNLNAILAELSEKRINQKNPAPAKMIDDPFAQ